MFGLAKCAKNAATGRAYATGWLAPVVDPRDYTDRHEKVEPLIEKLHLGKLTKGTRGVVAPPATDLRQYCSPVENQGRIGSCTAHAAVGVVEYYQRRVHGKHTEGSRLFVYKVTRNLLGVTGDTGAWLRNTMGALVLCGVVPEQYWPYSDEAQEFDKEPPQFCYAVADNYQAVRFFSHDPLAKPRPKAEVLSSVKKYLVAGLPAMFGFFGFDSAFSSDDPAAFPVPTPEEIQSGAIRWGHAVVAVGYDDKKKVTNTQSNRASTGAFLIRNSWGGEWGMGGYGWLPYEYVTLGLAIDFWSLIAQGWVDTGKFGL